MLKLTSNDNGVTKVMDAQSTGFMRCLKLNWGNTTNATAAIYRPVKVLNISAMSNPVASRRSKYASWYALSSNHC